MGDYLVCQKCGFTVYAQSLDAIKILQNLKPCCLEPYFKWQLHKGLLYEPDMILEDHIRKIRRRVEDCLRKSDPETILGVAKQLGVKID